MKRTPSIVQLLLIILLAVASFVCLLFWPSTVHPSRLFLPKRGTDWCRHHPTCWQWPTLEFSKMEIKNKTKQNTAFKVISFMPIHLFAGSHKQNSAHQCTVLVPNLQLSLWCMYGCRMEVITWPALQLLCFFPHFCWCNKADLAGTEEKLAQCCKQNRTST